MGGCSTDQEPQGLRAMHKGGEGQGQWPGAALFPPYLQGNLASIWDFGLQMHFCCYNHPGLRAQCSLPMSHGCQPPALKAGTSAPRGMWVGMEAWGHQCSPAAAPEEGEAVSQHPAWPEASSEAGLWGHILTQHVPQVLRCCDLYCDPQLLTMLISV